MQTPINPKGKGPLSLGSPDSLQFGNLSINDARSGTSDYDTDRSGTPFRGPSRNRSYTSSPSTNTPAFRDFGRRNSNARYRGGYNTRASSGSFRNSRTWISPDQQAQQEFLIIRNSMRRLFKFAEVSKWKFPDYIAHREAMVAAQANSLAQRVKDKEEARSVHSPPIPLELQQNMRNWGVHGNFDEVGNYGRVLGSQTIWCTDWQNGKEEVAPWPTMAEMKWEGDDRAKTGVGRFLALPREEGPAALMWNQLPIIEQYPLDQTAKIPTLEDIYLPVDDQIEPDHEYLWSKELEQDMDIILEG
ncbi:hypothetical protein IQ07DRAFT_509969 [Pyrenochaeta sp. DS3sAY3a]|nr:hypothetical protein IQ07DRAFT_509969 [Pyrenochaeta sp. DS3sAY3a]